MNKIQALWVKMKERGNHFWVIAKEKSKHYWEMAKERLEIAKQFVSEKFRKFIDWLKSIPTLLKKYLLKKLKEFTDFTAYSWSKICLCCMSISYRITRFIISYRKILFVALYIFLNSIVSVILINFIPILKNGQIQKKLRKK